MTARRDKTTKGTQPQKTPQPQAQVQLPQQQQSVNIDKDVDIRFTPAHLGIVVGHLRKGAYEQVAPVLAAIEQQVVQQMQPKQPTKAATTAESTTPV